MKNANKILITKLWIPLKKAEWSGICPPKIKGLKMITTGIVLFGGKYYEQFEYVPNKIDLCENGNAIRKNDFVILKSARAKTNKK